MRRHFGIFLALVAWLFATGSHWDLVQTFGWGKMIATYAQTMPMGEAIRLTFTPDNFCGICTFVQDAKSSADQNPNTTGKDTGKIILGLAASDVMVPSPVLAQAFLTPALAWPEAWTQDPPGEPPRAV